MKAKKSLWTLIKSNQSSLRDLMIKRLQEKPLVVKYQKLQVVIADGKVKGKMRYIPVKRDDVIEKLFSLPPESSEEEIADAIDEAIFQQIRNRFGEHFLKLILKLNADFICIQNAKNKKKTIFFQREEKDGEGGVEEG